MRPERRPVAIGSITARCTSAVVVRTGKWTGSGPLTSTPSTVKPSGRKTLARPQRTFPSSCGAPVPDAPFLAGADALGQRGLQLGVVTPPRLGVLCEATQVRSAVMAPRSASPQAVAALPHPALRLRPS